MPWSGEYGSKVLPDATLNPLEKVGTLAVSPGDRNAAESVLLLLKVQCCSVVVCARVDKPENAIIKNKKQKLALLKSKNCINIKLIEW